MGKPRTEFQEVDLDKFYVRRRNGRTVMLDRLLEVYDNWYRHLRTSRACGVFFEVSTKARPKNG